MKLKLITFIAVLVFSSAGFVSWAHAQDDETDRANIPFEFYAGRQKMPAGRYRVGIDIERRIITFTDESGTHRLFLSGTIADEGDGTSLLVFRYSQNVYALERLTGNAYNWEFQARAPGVEMQSRNVSSQIEIALNR